MPGSAAGSIGEATGLDLNIQAFPPADGQGAFTLASANYACVINTASDDAVKASAQEFLHWAGSPEQTAPFAERSGFVDVLSATENPAPAYKPIGELLETGAFIRLPNASRPNPAIYDALGEGVQGLLTGQKTVDQVLDEMDAAGSSDSVNDGDRSGISRAVTGVSCRRSRLNGHSRPLQLDFGRSSLPFAH